MAHRADRAAPNSHYSMTREQAEPWSIRALRADYLAQDQRARAATLSRVLRLLQDERRRKQVQPSALARLAAKVYGI